MPVRVFVGGPGSAIPKLDAFLSVGLSLDVLPLPVPSGLGVSPALGAGALKQNLVLAGAALGYKEGINLLPREFRAQKSEKVQRVSLRWLILLALFKLRSFVDSPMRLRTACSFVKGGGDITSTSVTGFKLPIGI